MTTKEITSIKLDNASASKMILAEDLVWPFLKEEEMPYVKFVITEGVIDWIFLLSTSQSNYTLEYSFDTVKWYDSRDMEAWRKLTNGGQDIYRNLYQGGHIYFRGRIHEDWPGSSTAPATLHHVDYDKVSYKMYGNWQALIDYTNLDNKTIPQNFFKRFCKDNTSITRVPDLYFENINAESYYQMFMGCTSLLAAPKIHAKVVGSSGCSSMFNGCTSLQSIPDLDFRYIDSYGCLGMFGGCTSLVTAPKIYDTTVDSNTITLYQGAYANMFINCTSLVTAPPSLPITIPKEGMTYENMFANCISLENAPVIGPHPYNYETDLNPYLPAGEYMSMFEGCSKLNYVKLLSYYHKNPMFYTNPFTYWLRGTASEGVIVLPENHGFDRSYLNLPDGWIIETIPISQ